MFNYFTNTWSFCNFPWSFHNNFTIVRETRQHVLLKYPQVLLFETEVVVTLKELQCRFHRMLTGHNVPREKIGTLIFVPFIIYNKREGSKQFLEPQKFEIINDYNEIMKFCGIETNQLCCYYTHQKIYITSILNCRLKKKNENFRKAVVCVHIFMKLQDAL